MHRIFTTAGKGNAGNQYSNLHESEQQREAHSAEELGVRDALERRPRTDKQGTQLQMSTVSVRFEDQKAKNPCLERMFGMDARWQ